MLSTIFGSRVLATQTSNPLSAKRNARDYVEGSNNHVMPSRNHNITLIAKINNKIDDI